MDKPRYQHDCENCTFLGELNLAGVFYDLYSHARHEHGFTELMARYGNSGNEYYSGLVGSVDNHPILIHALKRHCLLVK